MLLQVRVLPTQQVSPFVPFRQGGSGGRGHNQQAPFPLTCLLGPCSAGPCVGARPVETSRGEGLAGLRPSQLLLDPFPVPSGPAGWPRAPPAHLTEDAILNARLRLLRGVQGPEGGGPRPRGPVQLGRCGESGGRKGAAWRPQVPSLCLEGLAPGGRRNLRGPPNPWRPPRPPSRTESRTPT